jgi:hypothetical protein
LGEELAHGTKLTFVGVWLRVWPMKNGSYSIQSNSHARAGSFGNLCAKVQEQGFNVAPLHIPTHGFGEDGRERRLMFAHCDT